MTGVNQAVFAGEVGTCEPEMPNDYSAPLTKARLGIRDEERRFGVFLHNFSEDLFLCKSSTSKHKKRNENLSLTPKSVF